MSRRAARGDQPDEGQTPRESPHAHFDAAVTSPVPAMRTTVAPPNPLSAQRRPRLSADRQLCSRADLRLEVSDEPVKLRAWNAPKHPTESSCAGTLRLDDPQSRQFLRVCRSLYRVATFATGVLVGLTLMVTAMSRPVRRVAKDMWRLRHG
jgi:hypothetical protein